MRALDELRAALGDEVVRAAADIPERHLRDWVVAAGAGDEPLALALPRTTDEVSRLLACCSRLRVPVVPQGGLTGLSGGATPVRGCVLLSLQRMQGIEETDAQAGTLTVLAGTPLQRVQEAADAAGWLFPLDIGARGSCSIGGNAATNAGGNRVLRYGMMRDLVLGLEAVLPDGSVVSSLNKMQKNNAGFDLKQLFIGSEGALGVITRLVLRLALRPASQNTALCALADYAAASRLLRLARERLGPALSAFEVMWPEFYELALAHAARQGRGAEPLSPGHGLYLLVESSGFEPDKDADQFTALIEAAVEEGLVEDAALARSLRDIQAFWELRESGSDFLPALGPRVGFDISVPTGQIGDFVQTCREGLRARWPSLRNIAFGHAGDGNVHFIVQVDDRPLPVHEIEETVYGCVQARGGSIAAEHGVGLHKRPFLHYSRSATEIALMRTIKAALDPLGIMNPGKVVAGDGQPHAPASWARRPAPAAPPSMPVARL